METNKHSRTDPKAKRIPLWGHGPKVDPATKLELELWRDVYGVPFGRAIDALLAHARKHPQFAIPAKGKRTYRQIPRPGGVQLPSGQENAPKAKETALPGALVVEKESPAAGSGQRQG